MKLVLSKYIVRRRLEGGEFTYVYKPGDQSVTGKKAALALLKGDASAYHNLKQEAGMSSRATDAELELHGHGWATCPDNGGRGVAQGDDGDRVAGELQAIKFI